MAPPCRFTQLLTQLKSYRFCPRCLDMIPFLKDKMELQEFFCTQKNRREEASSCLECWGGGPAGVQEPVGLEDDPTAPIWLLRARGIWNGRIWHKDYGTKIMAHPEHRERLGVKPQAGTGSTPEFCTISCPQCQRIVILVSALLSPPLPCLSILILSHQ